MTVNEHIGAMRTSRLYHINLTSKTTSSQCAILFICNYVLVSSSISCVLLRLENSLLRTRVFSRFRLINCCFWCRNVLLGVIIQQIRGQVCIKRLIRFNLK